MWFLLSQCKAYTFKYLSYSNEEVQLLKFSDPFLPEQTCCFTNTLGCCVPAEAVSNPSAHCFGHCLVPFCIWTLLSKMNTEKTRRKGPVTQGWTSSSDINSLATSPPGEKFWCIFKIVSQKGPSRIEPQIPKEVTHLLIYPSLSVSLSLYYFSNPQIN